jgi:hypothetical protein
MNKLYNLLAKIANPHVMFVVAIAQILMEEFPPGGF